MHRRLRIALTTALGIALLAPVALDRDGFPLSTYPMYSRTRGDVVDFVVAYGIDEAGRRHELSLATIGASDDPLIVAGELRAAIRTGRADDRCVDIARRAAGDRQERALVAIEVVSERHDVVTRATGGDGLADRTVHARCDVGEPAT